MFDSLVNDRRQSKYAVEQAFRGIQTFVTEHWGEDVILQLDDPLTAYIDAARNTHECPLLFLEDLAEYFQFQWSDRQWSVWLRLRDKSIRTKKQRKEAWEKWQREVAPQFTVRKLTLLIARKARVPSFEPVTIFGSHCAPAGIFLGLCGLPEVGGARYAPSTPLNVMKSSYSLRELWKRAEWINGVKLPKLQKRSVMRPRSAADAVQLAAFCLALPIAIGVGILFGRSGSDLLAVFSGVVAFVASLGIGCRVADRIHNPLPEGIDCFGDLARLIVEQRQHASASPCR